MPIELVSSWENLACRATDNSLITVNSAIMDIFYKPFSGDLNPIGSVIIVECFSLCLPYVCLFRRK